MRRAVLLFAGLVFVSPELRAQPKVPVPLRPAPARPAPPPVPTVKGPAIPIKPPTLALPIGNDVDFDNWGFERGLAGWLADGTAFQSQPTLGNNVVTERVLTGMELANHGIGGDYWKSEPYPIGIKGTAWVGTFEARPDAATAVGTTQGDAPTGTLTSPDFKITKKYCAFLLGGGSDASKLRVELLVQRPDKTFTPVDQKTSFRNSEELARVEFDLTRHQGEVARIRIVDNATGNWGHINVDDFVFADTKATGILVRAGRNKFLVDKDAPVWGFFDTHAHPMAQEAFGKKIYIGDPTAPLAQTFSTDSCVANHSIGGRDKLLNDAFTVNFDPHPMKGWPDLVEFPRFNGKTHQKYHVDFIKRAWEGGLRLMSAVAVHNMYIATRGLGHGTTDEPVDDESVMYRELDAVKRMVQANSSWMEIAREPDEARRIIREGKLAIVLGVEADVFGNFQAPSSQWGKHLQTGPNRRDRALVDITDANADSLLDAKLKEYYDYGLRQILPVHYLSQPFGGTAVFNGGTFLPQIEFYDNVNVKGGMSRGVAFSLYEDFDSSVAFVGSALSYADYSARIKKQDQGAETSMVNADGLTSIGEKLFNKLMDRHFIVDVEHGSYETKDGIFRISHAHGDYPVIASHVDPLGLAFTWLHGFVRWPGKYSPGGVASTTYLADRIRNFATSNIRNIGHEMQLSDDNYRDIHARNGTVGVFMTLNRKRAYSGTLANVPETCSGSTTSFAQMYLHSLDKMGMRGVGLASDFPMVESISPRFGPYACWAMKEENDDSLKKTERTKQRMQQAAGVHYDRTSDSANERLFDDGDIELWEEDVWKALAMWTAHASSIPDSGEPGHVDRIRNLVKGLTATAADQLLKPGAFTGDAPAEQGAMFLLTHPSDPLRGLADDHVRDIKKMVDKVRPVFDLWSRREHSNRTSNNGPSNEPLRRAKTGNRDWDYNLDGLAHYGLVPDMLQDLANLLGAKKVDLMAPLFGSAEDYIEAWERAKAAH